MGKKSANQIIGENHKNIFDSLGSEIGNILNRIPITLRMVLLSLIVGVFVWIILDFFQSYHLRTTFQSQVLERIGEQAMEDRMFFDRHVKAYHQAVNVFVYQKNFEGYINNEEWDKDASPQIKQYTRLPPWLPKASIMRVFPKPQYALLLDKNGVVRELYQSTTEKIPESLLRPTDLLLQLSSGQSLMTTLDGAPFLVTSESCTNNGKNVLASLLIASKIDDSFLNAALGPVSHSRLNALLDGKPLRILDSNDHEYLPPGILIDNIKDRFLIVGKEFFDYGASDLEITFGTFISVEKLESLTRDVISKARQQRAVMAFSIILVCTLLTYILSLKIKQLTRFVLDFEKREFRSNGAVIQKGYELDLLKKLFFNLAEQIVNYREIIEKEAKEETRLIIDNAPEAIITTDAAGNIITWNPGAENIFGWKYEEVVNRNLSEFVFTDIEHELFDRGSQKIIQNQGRFVSNKRIEAMALHRDGHENPVELSVSFGAPKNNYNVIIFIRDISKRKIVEYELKIVRDELERHVEERTQELAKANEELQAEVSERQKILAALKSAKDAAESANNAKSAFLASMSHELRTPMNGVIGMTDLLLSMNLNAEQRQYAEMLKKSGEGLLRIINDILDFSKIEANKLDLECIDFNLRVVLKELSEFFVLDTSRKGLLFECEVAYDVPSLLVGDPGRLKQVIQNLVGNSLKFTREGKIHIIVKNEKETGKDVSIRFEVMDTGIGISRDGMSRLFKSFSQVDDSMTRKYGGTGLGLVISKSLVEMMGGRIGVESKENEGSTFWFTAGFRKQPEIWEEADISVGNIQDKHILVVDYDDSSREFFCSNLKSWKCRYTTSSDAMEALAILKKSVDENDPFDLAILHHLIPRLDCEELGQMIKSIKAFENLELLMITSNPQRGDASIIRNLGFSAYLKVPVKTSQLFDCLTTLLVKEQRTTSNENLPDFVTRHTLLDTKKRKKRILIAEDNEINRVLVINLLHRQGYSVDAVINGKEAVAALENDSYDVVLMDIQMPVMDGIKATSIIRSLHSRVRNHNVPVIALTANAMSGDKDQYLELGMNDYISKPIVIDQFLRVIEKYI